MNIFNNLIRFWKPFDIVIVYSNWLIKVEASFENLSSDMTEYIFISAISAFVLIML